MEAANIEKTDTILEVGPGRGALTELLLQKAGRVIAVEKDKELVDFLMDKFSAKGGSASGGKGQRNLSIINGDILKLKIAKLKNTRYKIVANIPYYITSHFLRKFLESDFQPSLMALMIQKEVAERIVAKSANRRSKESLLSISVKVYGQPKIIAKVPAENFSPPPKVDSTILVIENISKEFFNPPAGGNKIKETEFFRLLKLGFSHKRKMLKNNLKVSAKILQKCKIPALSRPENLSLNDWKHLYQSIEVQPQ